MATYAVGIDVGTGSARAGLVCVRTGALLAVAKHPLHIFSSRPEHHVQSSADIWDACTSCVRQVMESSGVAPEQVVGVGCDATCSLVCLDADGSPVGVDPESPAAAERNVVMWCDHRATAEAAQINAGGHARLRSVGGAISPEMELPKLLWLKRRMRAAFDRVSAGGKALDLADYLSHEATDRRHDVRSLCTAVCKWNYDAAPEGGVGWDASFHASIGFGAGELGETVIGAAFAPPGEPIEGGLGVAAAAQLGLLPGTALAVGMIDAHAGGLGCLGAGLDAREGAGGAPADALASRLALIAGTSTCHMASSAAPCHAAGVWGPYWGAMVPGFYLNEGGQSSAGSLLDHLVSTHASHGELCRLAEADGVSPTACLLGRARALATEASGAPTPRAVAALATDLHVGPDFLGNRSPLADPSMRGSVIGLTLSASLDDLVRLYVAAIFALAYQTRHIVDVLAAASHAPIQSLVACGGLSKNELYVSAHADVLGLPVHLPEQDEAVLLGAAMLGAAAGRAHASVVDAMRAMSALGSTVRPATRSEAGAEAAELAAFHERRYRVFRRMADDQREYRRIMHAD